jgi:hypothetical protein
MAYTKLVWATALSLASLCLGCTPKMRIWKSNSDNWRPRYEAMAKHLLANYPCQDFVPNNCQHDEAKDSVLSVFMQKEKLDRICCDLNTTQKVGKKAYRYYEDSTVSFHFDYPMIIGRKRVLLYNLGSSTAEEKAEWIEKNYGKMKARAVGDKFIYVVISQPAFGL